MWSKTVPTEPGHYWVKYKDGWQIIVLGELDLLRKKKLVFYFHTGGEIGQDGDSLVKEGSRFWSERLAPPDIQPAHLIEYGGQYT
jgi:hypothetical protein